MPVMDLSTQYGLSSLQELHCYGNFQAILGTGHFINIFLNEVSAGGICGI